MIHRRLMLAATAGALFARPAVSVAAHAQPLDVWRHVAIAEAVVSGVMRLPPKPVVSQEHWEIPVEEMTVLKGAPPSPLVIRHWPFDSGIFDNEGVPSLANQPAILFLVTGGDGRFHLTGLGSLMAATAENLELVRTTIAAQAAALAAWRPNPRQPHYAEVRRLIRHIASIRSKRPPKGHPGELQAAAFLALEELGDPAVPAIIDQMDDRRPLASERMSLRNRSPDAFEGLRQYGPELIVDALAAVLNQITGEHFGFIYNGATETQRRSAVDGWRIFAARRLARG